MISILHLLFTFRFMVKLEVHMCDKDLYERISSRFLLEQTAEIMLTFPTSHPENMSMNSSNLLVLAFILLFCILLTMKFSLAKHEILLGILVALLHFCSCMIEICCCFSSINVNLFQLTEDFLAHRLLHPMA